MLGSPIVRHKSVLENDIHEQLIAHWLSIKQELEYIFSRVLQLITFEFQDHCQTMGLLFP